MIDNTPANKYTNLVCTQVCIFLRATNNTITFKKEVKQNANI